MGGLLGRSDGSGDGGWRIGILLGALLLGLAMAATTIVGSVRMTGYKSLWLARTSAVLAMIPLPCPLVWLLGLPMGVWALMVLGRPEVKAAFAAARKGPGGTEQGTRGQTGGEPQAPAETPSRADAHDTPQFSRKAIWAVVWACGIPIGIYAYLFVLNTPGHGPSDELWKRLLGGVGCLVGASAALGAPLLGLLAMHDIRYSRGRVVGLPLAFGSGIALPLLLLAFVLAYSFGHMFAGMDIGVGSEAKAMLTLFVPLIVCFFIAVAAWRKVRPPVVASVSAQPAQRRWLGPVGWQILLCLVAVGASLVPILPKSDPFWGLGWSFSNSAPRGLIVESITPGSPAQQAGLLPGDVITAVDGAPADPTHSLIPMFDQIRAVPPRGQVRFAVDRGGQKVALNGVAGQPQIEAVLYLHWQFYCAAFFGVLAMFHVVTRPVSAPLWRPIVATSVALVGAACLVALAADPYVGGRLGFSIFWNASWGLCAPHWYAPRLQAIICLLAAMLSALSAAIGIRDSLVNRKRREASNAAN